MADTGLRSNDERLTVKQETLLKNLGYTGTLDLTKKEASSIIDAMINSGEKVEPSAARQDMQNPKSYPAKKPKEYHASPENVRIGALTCAIQAKKTELMGGDVLVIAKTFEDYINGN